MQNLGSGQKWVGRLVATRGGIEQSWWGLGIGEFDALTQCPINALIFEPLKNSNSLILLFSSVICDLFLLDF